ncbi:MAG: SCO family protein, partial [Jatrophihabitans sp.]
MFAQPRALPCGRTRSWQEGRTLTRDRGAARHARARRRLTGAVAVALVACGAAGCAASAPPPPAPSVGQQLSAPLAPAVADAALVSSTGAPVTLASLRGKVIVISDMMTLCQETCPLDTANLVAAARAAEQAGLGGKIEFLSVTIDPQRDTVDRLAVYRRLFEPAPADWAVLTGAPATLARFWGSLGVYIHRT